MGKSKKSFWTLLHPGVRRKSAGPIESWLEPLTPAQRAYYDTMIALEGSLRSADEMREAAAVLNPLIDVRAARERAGETEGVGRLDAILAEILRAAKGVRSSRSGMAVEICLESLHRSFEEAREELGRPTETGVAEGEG